MGIERRYNERLEVDFSVDICYRDHRPLLARAGNLSPEGMFLRTRRLRIPTGTLVRLDLRTPTREWSIDALVVHGDAESLGVMFREPQPQLYAELVREPGWRREVELPEPLVSGL